MGCALVFHADPVKTRGKENNDSGPVTLVCSVNIHAVNPALPQARFSCTLQHIYSRPPLYHQHRSEKLTCLQLLIERKIFMKYAEPWNISGRWLCIASVSLCAHASCQEVKRGIFAKLLWADMRLAWCFLFNSTFISQTMKQQMRKSKIKTADAVFYFVLSEW